MQDPDTCHLTGREDRFKVGFATPPPPGFHVEALAGGFVVHYSLPGEPSMRAVAHNAARLTRIVRDWAEALAPKPAGDEKEPGS